ncbi:MAG: NfeD family protein [Actinobacteria bacterium]|nr:NfeD family protein [Actinomycetota bacterium]
MVVAWAVVGVALLLFELHHWAFYALFGAIGALAAAMVAIAAPDAYALQAGVAVGLSTVGVVGVRPYVSRIVHSHRGGLVARGVHGGLVGQEVMTLDAVGDTHHAGHVRLAGERWLAISASGVPIEARTPVLVTAVQGTTLVVLPVNALGEEIG